jgi:hypothetical protein
MSAKRRASKQPGASRTAARPVEEPKEAERAAPSPRQSGVAWPTWVVLLVVVLVLFALTLWTWATWTDPIVDFGRELYVPWRITEGERLYRDLAYFNGPLSPYFNATLFRLFGVSLLTLVWANLAILAGTVALLWALLRRITTPFAATIGCIVFLACCAFAQQVYIANYNWITPYSHEATHGVALGLLSLWAVSRWRSAGQDRWLAVGGVAVGLAFLTKPEVFLAVLASNVLAVGLEALRSTRRAHVALLWTGCVLAPMICALLLLAGGVGFTAAAHGMLTSYAATLRPGIVGNPFYASVTGFDDPGRNILLMMRYVVVACALALPGAMIAWWGRRWPRWLAGASALVVTATLAFLVVPLPSWTDAGRVLPVALVGIALTSLPLASVRADDRRATTLTLSVFTLALLAKVLLNTSLGHYGFALAGPGLALAAAMLAGPVPEWVEKHGGVALAARACLLTLLAGPVITILVGTHFFIASKPVNLGEGGDRFHVNERGKAVESALLWIRERANGRPLTVAVLPEGVMLNYLARLPNPTPYFSLMPIEMKLFGERAMLAAYEAHPPDVVLVTHVDTRAYGTKYFGTDYGGDFARWLVQHYRRVQIFGDPPLQDGSAFGIAVMEKTERATTDQP